MAMSMAKSDDDDDGDDLGGGEAGEKTASLRATEPKKERERRAGPGGRGGKLMRCTARIGRLAWHG